MNGSDIAKRLLPLIERYLVSASYPMAVATLDAWRVLGGEYHEAFDSARRRVDQLLEEQR